MVGFGDRWNWLVALLRRNAATIGVDADAIVVGNWQQGQATSVRMPGVIVYMSPGDLIGNTPRDGVATFRIFTVTRAGSIEEAAGAAVDMGWRIVQAIRAGSEGVMVRWSREKVTLDTVNVTLTAAMVEGLIEYDVR